jgi:hypothetical protein
MIDEKMILTPTIDEKEENNILYRISRELFEFSSQLLKYSLTLHHSVIGATTLTLQLNLQKSVSILVATKKHDDRIKSAKIKFQEDIASLETQYKMALNDAEYKYQDSVKSVEREYN